MNLLPIIDNRFINCKGRGRSLSSTVNSNISSHAVSNILYLIRPLLQGSYRYINSILTVFQESFTKLVIAYRPDFSHRFISNLWLTNRYKIFIRTIFLLINQLQLLLIILLLYVIIYTCWHTTMYRISYSIIYYVSLII